MALYRDHLLIDLYEDWVLVERERLSHKYGRALTGLLSLQANGGDLHGAVATAQKLVEHDDLSEEAHRLVIGLHQLAGDRAAALHAYNKCRRTRKTANADSGSPFRRCRPSLSLLAGC